MDQHQQQQYPQGYAPDYQHQNQHYQQPGYNAPQPMYPNDKASSQPQPDGLQPVHQHHSHDHSGEKAAQKGSSKWAFGLFDCFSPLDTCCISFWCPCYLFGKTYERNTTNQRDPSGFNGMCCAYAVTLYCGCAPIVQCMQRQSTREKHGIQGGCFEDFCTSCCCSCCALIQEEKESVVRVTDTDPKTGAVYRPVQAMNYA